MRCDNFLTTSNFKVKYDFLKHCNHGENDLFEDKPIDIENFGKTLKYNVSVNKSSEYYNF